MRLEDREALRRRFAFRCGYCGVSESDIGAELTVDHFQPRSRDGPDEPASWVYSSFNCNNHKSDVWAPDSPLRILHLLNDRLSEQIAEQPDGTVTGLTETGRFHVEQIQLNRPPLIAHRLARRREVELRQALEEALRQQEGLRQRVAALEQAVAEAERRLSSL
jgi:HNH endonuclease